jgi:peptidoglycan/xylan/chitin deacetylase (PgdA/CDA1 family)
MIRAGLSGFSDDEIFVLRLLLYPYRVELVEGKDDSDLVIHKGASLSSAKPLIRFVTSRNTPYQGYPRDHGNGTVDMPFDLIGACSEICERVGNPRIKFAYRLATSLPFQYNSVPQSIRDLLLRTQAIDSTLLDHITIEKARRTLKRAFHLLGFPLERKKPPSLLITHDIETNKGFRGALALKDIDDKLGVRATWFLCSHEYEIPRPIARELADGATIGSHDMRHDGRLVRIRKDEELVKRLLQSRLKLEDIFEVGVQCFRAPLLQSNHRILSGLSKACYRYDFSLPCWEPAYPLTGTGFGIELLQEFEADGIVRVPLTLFQDHQLLNVLRLSVDDCIKLWVEQAKLISSFEGDLVLLVHPDYSFSREPSKYEDLLVSLLEIQALPVARD